MIRCTQYEKAIPVSKDRFAFLFVALSEKIGIINPQSIVMGVYSILNYVGKFLLFQHFCLHNLYFITSDYFQNGVNHKGVQQPFAI